MICTLKADNVSWKKFRSLLRLLLDTYYPTWADPLEDTFQKPSQYTLKRWAGLVKDTVVPGRRLFETFLNQYGDAFPPHQATKLRELLAEIRQFHREQGKVESIKQSKPNRIFHIPSYSHIDDTRLFGVTKFVEDIIRLCLKNKIVSIEGIGGIGKTTIALAVTRKIANKDQFDGVIWIIARKTYIDSYGKVVQESNPSTTYEGVLSEIVLALDPNDTHKALSLRQKEDILSNYIDHHRLFVVVDNIETIEELNVLLPKLHDWSSRGAHFLITSRERIATQFAFVISSEVPALNFGSSLNLLRHYGRPLNITQETGEKIYDTVGGVPLALQLVCGLLRREGLDLEQIMAQLNNEKRSAENIETSVDVMFRYLFGSIWIQLGKVSKYTQDLFVLLARNLPDTGYFTQEEMVLVQSNFENPSDFIKARKALLDYYIISLSGSVSRQRFQMHRLTQNFIIQSFFE